MMLKFRDIAPRTPGEAFLLIGAILLVVSLSVVGWFLTPKPPSVLSKCSSCGCCQPQTCCFF